MRPGDLVCHFSRRHCTVLVVEVYNKEAVWSVGVGGRKSVIVPCFLGIIDGGLLELKQSDFFEVRRF